MGLMQQYMCRGLSQQVHYIAHGGMSTEMKELMMRARHYGLLALKAQQQVLHLLLVKEN
jgi:hypothetical protein